MSQNSTSIFLTICLSILLLVSYSAQADLEHLDFLSGNWTSADFGKGATEVWIPGGKSMAGVFKGELNDGRVITEFMLIDTGGDQTVLRWNHFNEDYSRWEQEPIEHVLVESRPNYANFQMTAPEKGLPRNMVYSIEADQLRVWVGDLSAKNQKGAFELVFTRQVPERKDGSGKQ